MLNVAKAIADYLYREFDEWVEPEELLKQETIGVAYTTTLDENDNEVGEIQVNVDLKRMVLETYIDDVLVETIQYDSVKEMQDEFEVCDFDDFVRF